MANEQNQSVVEDKSSETIKQFTKEYPVSESLKALIRVTPYRFDHPWIQASFKSYDVMVPICYGILGILIMWKISYHTFRCDPASKVFELIQNGFTALFFLKYFPDIFIRISKIIEGMQEKVLDFSLTQDQAFNVMLNTGHAAFMKDLLFMFLTTFLGPIGWVINACCLFCWFFPLALYVFYKYSFLFGLIVLIYGAPFIFVAGTIYRLGIAISVFFWMMVVSMIWPVLWATIGRVAFVGLGNMNLIQAFGFTLIVGVVQGIAPILFIRLSKGQNPGEAAFSMMTSFARRAGLATVSAPLGTLAAPALGVMSGAKTFSEGARSSVVGKSSGGGGSVGSAGRFMSGIKSFQKMAQAQKIHGTGSDAGQFERSNPFVHSVGRMGAHLNRAKRVIRGTEGKPTTWNGAGNEGGGSGAVGGESGESLFQNSSVYGLSLKDLSRYGMLRSAEKQAERWHAGTVGFLSAKKKARTVPYHRRLEKEDGPSVIRMGQGPEPRGPAQEVSGEIGYRERAKLGTRLSPVALLGSFERSQTANGSVLHMGGPLHPGANPRRIPYDSSNRRIAQLLEKNSRYFDFKEVPFSVSTHNGIEKINGYAAFSKKTGAPKAYYIPKSLYQEIQGERFKG